MLTLYRFPGAVCAFKVLMALYEKSTPFEDKVIAHSDLATPWYREMNPMGVVPTIIHDGNIIIESSVILNYLEDCFDGPKLRPDKPLTCARMNYWLKIVDDAISHIGVMTYSIFSRYPVLKMDEARREAHFAAIPSDYDRLWRRSVVENGLDAPEVMTAMKKLVGLQREANEYCARNDYLVGDFTLADAAFAPFAARMEQLGLLLPADKTPAFHQWWDKIKQRPSYQKAVHTGVPSGIDRALREAASKDFPRLQALMATL